MDKDRISSERILQMTICLIDESGGAINVGFRDIARRLGCSAPNLYNYFSSFDDLLNKALSNICSDFIKTLRNAAGDSRNPEELLLRIIRSYIEYALRFPGRLNFFHYERIEELAVEEARLAAARLEEAMAMLLELSVRHRVGLMECQMVCRHIHAYLIGSLKGQITSRDPVPEQKQRTYTDQLASDCKQLFIVLLANRL